MRFDLEQEQLLLRRRLEVIARATGPDVQAAVENGYGPDIEEIEDQLKNEYLDTFTRGAFISQLNDLDDK